MADPNVYDIGAGRRLMATFADLNGAVADPTTVTFEITEPDGTTTSYVYGTDAEVVKSATGIYYVDWTIASAGRHYWKFTGAGAVIAAGEASFLVRESHIV